MIRNLKLLIILLGIVAAVVCSSQYSAAISAVDLTSLAVQDQQTQRELTPQEKRGKAFYLRSETSSGQEITALLGDIDVPASTLTCAGCHGARGEGKTEGGVTAGNLTWSFLTKPYGHSDGGRKHPAYTEASFIRALTSGLDPAGNKMAVAMPVYRMTQQEMTDLIAYLKRIETDRDPGLTETTLVLGTVVPDKGPLAALGEAMREVLQAYFAEINSRGGIYNRRIELRIATGDATSTIANTKLLIEESQVFAIVGGVTAGADEALAALSQQSEVPFVGPSTLLPQQNLPLNRYIFYLFAGLHEQARALANFATKRMDRQTSRVAILCPDAGLNKQIAASIEDQGKKRGWNKVAGVYYPRERLDTAQQVASLKQQGVDTVFFLGAASEARALFKDAETANWTPSILLLGSLVGREITDAVPIKMKDKIFLAFPTVPADVSVAGAQEYGALAEKYKIRSSEHSAARLSAFAAAKILVEALKLAGKDLSRERLVTTLEGLYEFETGLTPKITFGPNRRIGALGAYVVTIDPEKKLFPVNAEWISVE